MLPMGLSFKVCWAFDQKSCPTLTYLEELKFEDADCFYSVVDGIDKIQSSDYLRPELVKPLPINKQVRDIYELRVQGGTNRHYSRIALIYTKAREVVLLNGVSKKDKKASSGFIGNAVGLRNRLRNGEMDYEQIPIEQIRQNLEQ
jgi:Phage derived protein Gp49-like (DUF891)